MKLLAHLAVISSFALPLMAHAQRDLDACKPVFEACAAQGFTKDDTAPAGKKIWANCANVIIAQKKAVPTVAIDPNGADAKYCREYKEAKEKFDAEFARTHKKTP